jgi:hypothetical protein
MNRTSTKGSRAPKIRETNGVFQAISLRLSGRPIPALLRGPNRASGHA